MTETGLNSSPITKGVLFRAVKPAAEIIGEQVHPTTAKERPVGEMEYLLNKALELGAEKARKQ